MTDRPPRTLGAAALLAVKTAEWLAAVGLVAVAVPLQKRRFDEHGVQLPAVTRLALDAADAVGPVPLAVGGTLVLAAAVYVARYRTPNRAARAVITLGVSSVPLLALLLAGAAVGLAELKFREVTGR